MNKCEQTGAQTQDRDVTEKQQVKKLILICLSYPIKTVLF